MLQFFSIFTTGGIILWHRSFENASHLLLNGFISDVFTEEADSKSVQRGQQTFRWILANDLGLVFVAAYQTIRNLTFVEDLLAIVRTLFCAKYKEQVKQKDYTDDFSDFDKYFDKKFQELESRKNDRSGIRSPEPFPKQLPLVKANTHGQNATPALPDNFTEKETVTVIPGTNSRSSPISSSASKGPSGARQRLVRKGANGRAAQRSRSIEEPITDVKKSRSKELRKWNDDGFSNDVQKESLDYSGENLDTTPTDTEKIISDSLGDHKARKGMGGEISLAALDDDINHILQDSSVSANSKTHGAVNFFRNLVGSKTLSLRDLEAPLAAMHEHLLKKNVAPEVAGHICNSVKSSLDGHKSGSFQSIQNVIKTAMEDTLRRILTAKSSNDILRDIGVASARERPYVISVVGVNGVGKSTSLSKIAFWLLQNRMKILIAACDTFRSGAVEQLKIHARTLKELSRREGHGDIELYEKGYGKDAAVTARDAIIHASNNGFDVVLIDTAGRRHSDQRLMSSLEKFAKLANPDKILMVGEALVGTDSVQQARSFNTAFGSERGLDGFIISKVDAVGDMIGTLVSMVYATKIPVLFIGTGQTYTDLKVLSISWAVKMLMN